jgi:ELWxxDGT repeat protein
MRVLRVLPFMALGLLAGLPVQAQPAFLVKDINTTTPQHGAPASYLELGALGSALFLTADDGTYGGEVWRSDGTAAGTHLAMDLLPGSGSSQPDSLAAVDNTLLFSAYDGVHGVEAWRTDGTPLGTRMVQDIAPGPLSSSPTGFTAAGPNVYSAADDNTTGFELWAMPQDAVLGTFADVPADYWAARFIEQLAADGVTSGCGGGNYCPDQPITRGEMAVFLATAFHLPLP